MLSYSKLGKQGLRTGNQLFQYAFLRTEAERLGVKFYCPKWIGDEIFELNDETVRVEESVEERAEDFNIQQDIKNYYKEPMTIRFYQNPFLINDNTEIDGHFESEKCFDKDSVKEWYKFKQHKISRVREKYRDIDFTNSIAVHLRLGDKMRDKDVKVDFYVPRKKYYLKSLSVLVRGTKIPNSNLNQNLLVFSDEPKLAKKYFDLNFMNRANKIGQKSGVNFKIIFIEDNQDFEDLYLICRCSSVISGTSTFGWWGGYLGFNPDKKVVFPKEGLWRPRIIMHEKNLVPKGWIKIKALYPIIDNYFIVCIIYKIRRLLGWV